MTLPSPGYGPLPWWVWNGTMKYAEIERQLGLMKNAGMEGWTLWARFGLEVEYLSHDFMQRLQFAVEKSAQLGLEVWALRRIRLAHLLSQGRGSRNGSSTIGCGSSPVLRAT